MVWYRSRVIARARLGWTVVAFALLVGSACKKDPTPTTVASTWRNPEQATAPFSKIFVVGVGRNDDNRRLYEDNMVRALERKGATAQASWTLFPKREDLDRAKMLVEVRKQQFDAVLVARLRSVEQEKKFVPAQPLTSSDLYMSGYDPEYAVNSAPAHFEDTTTYQVQTALYSVRDETIAWVAWSDTVDPESPEDVIRSVSKRIAQAMKDEGLID